MSVEFVSYDSPRWTYCDGVLVMLIDGTKWTFATKDKWPDLQKDVAAGSDGPGGMFAKDFWVRRPDWLYYQDNIMDGGWEFYESKFPKSIRHHFKEVCDEFRKNVQPCCCGGCE